MVNFCLHVKHARWDFTPQVPRGAERPGLCIYILVFFVTDQQVSTTEGSPVSSSPVSISVVLPMYNEEKNAENAVKSLNRVLSDSFDDYEILVVESGSTDLTRDIADRLADSNPAVRVIHQINREGLGSAIRLGFANARKDFILYIDSDEPFDVEEIARVIPMLDPRTALIGYRIGERESFKRKLFSRVYNTLVQLVFRLGVRDVNFSMKLIPRTHLQKLDLRANGCFYDAELLAELKRAGIPVTEIGFAYNQRQYGMSSLDRLPVILDILREMIVYLLRRKRRVIP